MGAPCIDVWALPGVPCIDAWALPGVPCIDAWALLEVSRGGSRLSFFGSHLAIAIEHHNPTVECNLHLLPGVVNALLKLEQRLI